jgi:hypothetical protein
MQKGKAGTRITHLQPVRSAYQPPASSTFLSKQISHQQPASSIFSQNKPASAISHQPTEQAAYYLNLPSPKTICANSYKGFVLAGRVTTSTFEPTQMTICAGR